MIMSESYNGDNMPMNDEFHFQDDLFQELAPLSIIPLDTQSPLEIINSDLKKKILIS